MSISLPLDLRLRRAGSSVVFGVLDLALVPWRVFNGPGNGTAPPHRSFLVVNLLGLGDHITALPALAAIRASLPKDCRLEMLIAAGPRLGRHVGVVELYRLGPSVDAVHLYTGPGDAVALRGRHDHVAVFGARAGDALVGRLAAGRRGPAGGRVEVSGFDHGGRGGLLDRRVPLPAQAFRSVAELAEIEGVRHQVDVWLGLARDAGLASPNQAAAQALLGPRLDLGDEGSAGALAMARDAGLDISSQRPLVVLHGWNHQPHYRWAAERWAQLAARLVADHSVCCAITGPHHAAAREFCAQVCAEAQATGDAAAAHVRDLSGLLDLGGLAGLAQGSRVFVSVDTGVTHLAAAAGGRVVAIFGPGSPRVWGPWGEGHTVVMETDVCHGCRLSRCVQFSHDCLEALDVGRVQQAVVEKL